MWLGLALTFISVDTLENYLQTHIWRYCPLKKEKAKYLTFTSQVEQFNGYFRCRVENV